MNSAPDPATPDAGGSPGRTQKPRSLLSKVFGPGFFGFAAVAAGSGIAVYMLRGGEAVAESLSSDLDTFLVILPNFLGAMLMAFFLPTLLPRAFMERLIGEDSGVKGMVVATAAGTVTPGGPMTSFPLLIVLRNAGAGLAPLISYMTSWSTIGLQRILIWEIQLLGLEFALVRIIASAPLGIIAGLLSRFAPPPPGINQPEPIAPAANTARPQ